LLAHVEQAVQMHATPSLRLSRSELQGEVAGLRAFLAFRRGDLPGTITLACQSLEQTASSSTSRGFIAWCLGIAYGLSGDIRAATQAQTEARLISQAQGNDYATFLATFELASFQVLQGHLHHAQQLYQQALHVTSARQETLPASGSALVGLGCLEYEWHHLEAAAQLLREGITRCTQIGSVNAIMQGYDRLAWVKQAQSDATGARALFAEAMQIAQRYHLTPQRLAQLEARRVRLLLVQGDVAEALRWAQSCQVSSEDENDSRLYQRESEYLTLVRVYLAQQECGEAARLLRRLLPVAQAQGRRGSVLEILLLQALIYQAQGETARAVVTLEKALMQAEPEGYVRLFVDEGAPLAALLQQVLAHWKAHRSASYVRSLLQASEQQGHPAPAQARHQSQGALDPLSQRERTVLGLLAAGLSTPEMAEELVVSPNTIKTQISSLYRKLNASNRKEAIAMAQRWHLL
jgi:LuxR family maltose regulon positive regulatory protein